MTGFSSKTIEIHSKDGDKAHLTITLKSLNSRFFEGICRLPHALQSIEVDLITLMKKRLYRGKAMLAMNTSNYSIFKGPVEPSIPIIKKYLNAIKAIEHEFNLNHDLTIRDIIQLPDVLGSSDTEIDASLKKKIIDTAQEVITMLIAAQEQEGQSLYNDIKKRCEILQVTINEIQQRFDTVMHTRKKETQKILQELDHEQTELAAIRRNQLLLELERLDIHEEIVRFNSHLKSLHELLDAKQVEKGRKIEFMLQELGRETNTIAAKSAEFGISSLAITMKVELEKIREQAQNIV